MIFHISVTGRLELPFVELGLWEEQRFFSGKISSVLDPLIA